MLYSLPQVPIGDYVDAADLNSKIDALPRPDNGETFYGALVKIRSMFQADHRFDGKPYKRFVAIFITDGQDGDGRVQSEATAAHADDIVIISIGKTDVSQSVHHTAPNQITAQLVILDYYIITINNLIPPTFHQTVDTSTFQLVTLHLSNYIFIIYHILHTTYKVQSPY